MKNPKIGERCALYWTTGIRVVGTIDAVEKNSVFVTLDEGARIESHRTSLIRLKPKPKPREILISEHNLSVLNESFNGDKIPVWKERPELSLMVLFREVL